MKPSWTAKIPGDSPDSYQVPGHTIPYLKPVPQYRRPASCACKSAEDQQADDNAHQPEECVTALCVFAYRLEVFDLFFIGIMVGFRWFLTELLFYFRNNFIGDNGIFCTHMQAHARLFNRQYGHRIGIRNKAANARFSELSSIQTGLRIKGEIA